jgi:hypothetical protein
MCVGVLVCWFVWWAEVGEVGVGGARDEVVRCEEWRAFGLANVLRGIVTSQYQTRHLFFPKRVIPSSYGALTLRQPVELVNSESLQRERQVRPAATLDPDVPTLPRLTKQWHQR